MELQKYPITLDEIDQWLADNFGILPGACSSTENLRHNTARMIAEVLWPWEEAVKASFQQGYEQAEKDLGWISVKDRLPETTEYVFTCVNQFGVPQCIGFHYYKDGKWWEGYEEDVVGAVEYWMPIPRFKEAKK